MAAHRLVIVRHAKAAQGLPDADRPLTERGAADAVVVGGWLEAHDVVPDLAVVSPARRARQTWKRAASGLGRDVPVVVDRRIYDNTVTNLYDVLRECDEAAGTVVVVGHNPSLHALAVALADDAGAVADFPTATVAVLSINGSWVDLPSVASALTSVVTCRA